MTAGTSRGRLVSLTLASCAMALMCAPSAAAQPAMRVAGERPASTSPEAGLWTISDAAEVDARQSAEVNRDPALNAYVGEVACKVAAAYCDHMRVYLMDRPIFNASMAPNGYMEVWSGLMLRTKNEDELAFVLGHEVGHFAHSHHWQSFQDKKARADTAMMASFLISAVGVVAMANAGSTADIQNISNATQGLVNAVYLGAVSGMFTFSRANESESDAYGFSVATQANYSPSAPSAIWRRLRQETAASDFQRVRDSDTRASIFDSHPLVSDRIDALDQLAKDKAESPSATEQRYRAAIRPHLSAWLKDDLRRRDFGQTLFIIDQLSTLGEDQGVLNFYRGEAIRLRRSQGYQAAAEQAYRAAIAHPDVPAAAFRELADLAEKRGEKSEMADLLITYLQRAPTAKDAAFVKMRIEQIKPIPETAPEPPVPEAAPAIPPVAAPAEQAPVEAPLPVKPAPPVAAPPVAMSLVEPS